MEMEASDCVATKYLNEKRMEPSLVATNTSLRPNTYSKLTPVATNTSMKRGWGDFRRVSRPKSHPEQLQSLNMLKDCLDPAEIDDRIPHSNIRYSAANNTGILDKNPKAEKKHNTRDLKSGENAVGV
jgi:hypothetical protein